MTKQVDIRNASFEEFVKFLFDHKFIPLSENEDDPERWYWNVEVEFDPIRTAHHYTKLFSEPEFLTEEYSIDQRGQAFWAIQGGIGLDFSIDEIIWDDKIPLNVRVECIRAMAPLYERLFAKETIDPGEGPVHMWWDSLAYGYSTGDRVRSNGIEESVIQDAMFEVLKEILKSPAEHCQVAALHGLGHLRHPDTDRAISEYFSRNPRIDPELKDYAESAARFDVL